MHPLAPGTRVKAWRVKAWQGQGGYGAVYRAERVGFRRSEPGALKVSLSVWNWRMEREVELLSRLSHPSIPRLLDRGGPQLPSGDEYPFFVMQWVQGTPLYAWAEQSAPSSRQLCRVVAQLARALEAVHAAGAVHRDVKGDNILVRLSDRLPVLVDFGSCHFAGAQRLTWQSLPPVTPDYLSPQALLFYLHSLSHPDGYYPPSPADDLYALGVTAYRLVMGQYPERINARQDEQGCWQVTSPDVRPQLESNPRVEPALREVIIRLLSDDPAVRGTATQVAEALEAMADERVAVLQPAVQSAAEVAPSNVPAPVVTGEPPKRPRPVVRGRAWKPWLVMAAAGVSAVLLWSVLPPVHVTPEHVFTSTPQASESQAPDAGTAAVGNTSSTEPQASPSEKKPIAEDSPPEPRPGQIRPDQKGRCPGRTQVLINGGCWMANPSATAEECKVSGYLLLKGKCYGPALEPPRKAVPTSNPAEAR